MRRPEEINTVALFYEMGLSKKAISRITGIPRRTVQDWLAGQVPRGARLSGESCPDCGHPPHRPEELPARAYAYLLGLYLGDGHVARFRRTMALRVFLDSRYPRIIAECVWAIRRVLPENRVSAARTPPVNLVRVQACSKQWPCLLPQHGPGRKHTRRIALEPWQERITHANPEVLIRGLIHSDGSRFSNPVRAARTGKLYVYPRYYFSNVSEDIKAIFCEHLDLLGIEWKRNGPMSISIARRASVAKLDEFVGPKR
jgi:hypothetical protein